MKNIVQKVLSLCICCVLVFCSTVTAFAKGTDDYKKFQMGDSRWGSLYAGGGQNISSWGCLIVSLSMIMAYADPDLRDVSTFNPGIAAWGDSKQNIQPYLNVGDGGTSTDYFKQGPIKYKECAYRSSYSMEENAKWIKKQLDAGLYVMVWGSGIFTGSTTHFSVVTGWDSKKNVPIVWDVCTGPDYKNNSHPGKTNWEIFASCGLQCYTYSSSKKSAKETILANDGSSDSGSDSSNKLTKEDEKKIDEISNVTLSEWELNGMPKASDICAKIGDLPTNSDLTLEEKQAMSKIQSDIDDSSTKKNIASIVLSAVGVLLILYAVVLLCCYLFDSVNSLVEGSLVSLLTFGKVKLMSKYDRECVNPQEMKELGYISDKKLISIIVIVFIVGISLVSGLLIRLIYSLVLAIKGVF